MHVRAKKEWQWLHLNMQTQRYTRADGALLNWIVVGDLDVFVLKYQAQKWCKRLVTFSFLTFKEITDPGGRKQIMSESRETMQNLMWRQGQSGLGSSPQITPQIFMGMLMTTSRFLMSGLNLWLHTGLSDLDVLTVVIILVSSVRQAGGLNLPQLDWLMFSLSHSLVLFGNVFVVSWRARKHTACRFCPANSRHVIGNVSHLRVFYILWEM